MPEPITPTAAALAGAGATAPILAIAGVSLGLQVDVLIAGFAGAMAAIILLDSVPSTGDTWQELLRTTARRLGVAITSALAAGYLAPVAAAMLPAIGTLSTSRLEQACALVIGCGAQQILKAAVNRFAKQAEGA